MWPLQRSGDKILAIFDTRNHLTLLRNVLILSLQVRRPKNDNVEGFACTRMFSKFAQLIFCTLLGWFDGENFIAAMLHLLGIANKTGPCHTTIWNFLCARYLGNYINKLNVYKDNAVELIQDNNRASHTKLV
jgi:hypothetical protein